MVCNRYGREAGLLEPADAETSLGRKIDWILPDDWKSSSSAVNMGAPLLNHAPRSKLRAAYQKMAADIANVAAPDSEPEAGAKPRGLFSFLGGQRQAATTQAGADS